jgi:hypothetical protein
VSRHRAPDFLGDPQRFAGLSQRLQERAARPTCHLCAEPVAPADLEEYDGQGEVFEPASVIGEDSAGPILAIHRHCGVEDNAWRAERAAFAS